MQKKIRDSSIELLRIIGFFFVIGTHIKYDGIGKSDFFISSVFSDGVAVFFCYYGCIFI